MAATHTLNEVPRLDLRGFSSPLQLLERFSDEVGIEVWCKRDDIGAVGLAGNKVRKLEFELAHAQAMGANHLVTEGSRLSNSARATAAAAAALGMGSTLVLAHDHPDIPVGNLLLDGLFGADLRFVGDVSWAELAPISDKVVDELTERGIRAHRMPIGCATPRSSLGFAHAFEEVQAQLAENGAAPTSIVHASSSGGTHAGLVLGNALHGQPFRIIGVCVADEVYPDMTEEYLSIARSAAALIDADVDLEASDIGLTMDYLGEGYGLHADGTMEAIDLLATTEGILVDPVYSGKALAGLIDLARRGELGESTLFWHTGGFHALFDPHYGEQAWNSIPRLAAVTL